MPPDISDPKFEQLAAAILQAEISAAEKAAAAGAERQESGRVFSVTVARRELRAWLRGSDEGIRVEEGVGVMRCRRACVSWRAIG